jgi:hypothetical protein
VCLCCSSGQAQLLASALSLLLLLLLLLLSRLLHWCLPWPAVTTMTQPLTAASVSCVPHAWRWWRLVVGAALRTQSLSTGTESLSLPATGRE